MFENRTSKFITLGLKNHVPKGGKNILSFTDSFLR